MPKSGIFMGLPISTFFSFLLIINLIFKSAPYAYPKKATLMGKIYEYKVNYIRKL